MSILVKVPTQLRGLTQGFAQVETTGATVSEALTDLGRSYPGVLERILDEGGNIRRFVNVYLEDENVRFLDGVDTEIEEGNVIAIIPAVAGGSPLLERDGLRDLARSSMETDDGRWRLV